MTAHAPPRTPADERAAVPALAIHVVADGTLRIADKTIDDAELDRVLGALPADTEVIVYTASHSNHAAVVHVLDRAKQAGHTHLAIAPEAQ